MAVFLRRSLKLIFLALVGTVLLTLRYIIKTPQPLKSILPGKDHLYKWTYGHIFYKVLGEADAPPLLLLHAPGIGASSHTMHALMEPLARHFRVYAPDLPGFGLSDRPNMAYTAEIYVQLGHDFLVEVIGQPATLLAGGLSCNYSIAIARNAAEFCNGVVLLSPTALFAHGERKQRPWLAQLAKNPVIALMLYSVLTTPIVLRAVVARENATGYQDIAQARLAYLSAAAHQLGAQHAVLAHLAGALDLDVTDQLEQLTQPGLIIWGANALPHSHSIASRSALTRLKEASPVYGAGVQVQEECPDAVVADILTWREENEQKTSPAAPALQEVASVKEAPVVREEDAPQLQERQATTSIPAASSVEPEAYCVKCRQKRAMQNATKIVTKNGRAAMEGRCPVCGTKLFRFIAGEKE
ncbi:MAG TPA: alpha/beta fold hydrolase [Ktedonosporobacter sp.]|jgi:pimeloyl-ACP methyl ester carboxylesterase|nr:alpha/beta fold hydrolase [Ktedonosporobacter sp.]